MAEARSQPPDQVRLRASTNRTTSATQSESVRSRRCAAPQRRSATATRSRCADAAAANSRHSSGVVTTSRCRPVSGSASTTVPTSGSSSSRGSSTSTASSSWRADSARSARSHSGSPRKSETTTASPRRRGGRRSASTAAARSPRVPTGARGVRATRRSMPRACSTPPRAGIRTVCSPGADHHPDPVAAPRRQVRDGRQRGDGEVALLAGGRAEVQAGRQVHDHPGLQLPVRHRLPHVRQGRAGGDGPVHPAHVVAGLVDPRLPRLAARPGHQPEVVALQQPVEPAAHGQLQRPQRRLDPPVAQRRRRDRASRRARASVTPGSGRRTSSRCPSWRPGWAAPPGGAGAVMA